MSTRVPSSDQVRAALDEILGWSEVVRSPQLSKFLKHIVEAKLRGDGAGIKAYSIAVDVFGRPASFDPQTDPIVRVQARRLRGLLQEFERQNLRRTGVRITLPVGRYVPEFEYSEVGQPAEMAAGANIAAERPAAARKVYFGRQFWTQAIAAMSLVLLLGLLLVGLQVLRTPAPDPVAAGLPREPTVYLSALTNLTDLPSLNAYTSRLNDQLSSVLAQFEDVEVGFVEPGGAVAKAEASFLLSGTVASAVNGIEVTAVLTDAMSGSAVWNLRFNQPMPVLNTDAVAALAARRIMRELGPFRSPVHAQGRNWLDENTLQLPAVNGYVCLLTYRYAREFANPAAIAKAIDCHDRLLKQQPDLPLALAAAAWLQGRVISGTSAPADQLEVALAEPAERADRARQLAPESSFAYEQVGAIQNWQENYDTAQRSLAIALGFEPLNTDARANYAITLARSGDWSGAMRQAQFAIADTPYPSPWYYALPSLIAFRDGRLDRSIQDARIAAQGDEIGAIIALAAGGLTQDQQVITEFQARVMSTESLRRHGILPWLGVRIKDTALLGKVAEGLRAGGIPESALTTQF